MSNITAAYDPNPLYYEANAYLSLILTFTLNLTVIYLIIFRTPSSLKSYATILFAHCISDMLYEGVRFCTNVRSIPLNGKFYFLVGGLVEPSTPEDTLRQCLLYFWISVFVPIGMMSIDFICRYVIICRNGKFTALHVVIFVVTVYTLSFFYTCVVKAAGHDLLRIGDMITPEEYSYLVKTFNFGKQTPHFVVVDITDLRIHMLLGILNVCILFDYTSIGYITHRIYNKIKCDMASDPRVQRLNKQVLAVMLMQAFAPSILLVTTSISVWCAIFHIDKPSMYNLCASLIIAWVRPLATIILITPYRRVFVRGGKGFSEVTATSAVSHDIQTDG